MTGFESAVAALRAAGLAHVSAGRERGRALHEGAVLTLRLARLTALRGRSIIVETPRNGDAMRALLVTAVVACFELTVVAQAPYRATAARAMVDAASALLATVAGGPTGIETTIGFDRSKSLALGLDDAARESWTYWPTERAGVPLDVITAELNEVQQHWVRRILDEVVGESKRQPRSLGLAGQRPRLWARSHRRALSRGARGRLDREA